MQINTWRQKAFVYRSFIASLGSDVPAENFSNAAISS
jgi:hypothetical protein